MNFRKANKNEESICSGILKDAFRGYDFFEIYVNNQKRREKFFNIMMEIWMKNSFKYGNVLVAEENKNIVAVTVLKAPNEKDINFVDKSIKSIKMFLIGGIKDTKAFLKMCKVSDEACDSLPNPKWHLVLLAVSSKCKGKGIGSAMLQKCIIPYIAQY